MQSAECSSKLHINLFLFFIFSDDGGGQAWIHQHSGFNYDHMCETEQYIPTGKIYHIIFALTSHCVASASHIAGSTLSSSDNSWKGTTVQNACG